LKSEAFAPFQNNPTDFPTDRAIYFQLEKKEKEKPQRFENARTLGVSVCLGWPKPLPLDYCSVLLRFGGETLLHANPQVNSEESAYNADDAEGVSKWLHNITEKPLRAANNWRKDRL